MILHRSSHSGAWSGEPFGFVSTVQLNIGPTPLIAVRNPGEKGQRTGGGENADVSETREVAKDRLNNGNYWPRTSISSFFRILANIPLKPGRGDAKRQRCVFFFFFLELFFVHLCLNWSNALSFSARGIILNVAAKVKHRLKQRGPECCILQHLQLSFKGTKSIWLPSTAKTDILTLGSSLFLMLHLL